MSPHGPGGRLFDEILRARQRVYAIGRPTPLERIAVSPAVEVFLKREDLSPIHAYKWRGAYNRMALLSETERERGVVAASAGNHAQGVALAAQRLGVPARIYMPLSTPRMKQAAVALHGGDAVEIVLHGDAYDAAAEAALSDCAEAGRTFIHPYDDFATMGGQGTLADEIVMSGSGPFDVAYLQIGGGGMAAAVGCWLRHYYPAIRLVGVEGVEQASMAAAVKAGKPVALDYVDVFCDGTAVKKAGEHTYPLCRDLIDDFIQVTNEEVCAAIELLWEQTRAIPEPAGAMGLAGLLTERDRLAGKKAVVIVCGANMDFGRLAWIARHAGIGAAARHFYRFRLDERPGALLDLLETYLDGLNIVDFQYGKTDDHAAWPVIGVEASPPQRDLLERRFAEGGVEFQRITSEEDVEFRIIHYEPGLFRRPFFIKLEFPERAGALHDFLVQLRPYASICYFNYAFTGETVGRALLGFEFDSGEQLAAFQRALPATGRSYEVIGERVLSRIL